MIAFIGSSALCRRVNLKRLPRDLDIIGTYDEVIDYMKSYDGLSSLYPISGGKKVVAKYKDGFIIEAEIAWENSSAEQLLHLIQDDPNTIKLGQRLIPSLNLLYMLKMSHRYLKNSKHFNKTMDDIILMREYGAIIQDEHQEFYQKRMEATYTYSHPSLMQSKDNFFEKDGGVKYVYDHDDIHKVMKQGDMPAYQYFKADGAEVFCSKEKFFACDKKIQLNAVLEESLVLALERSQIPYPDTPREKSFLTALQKVCTSITSGWFREFSYDNYYLVLNKYHSLPYNYVDKFNEAVLNGEVGLFNGEYDE